MACEPDHDDASAGWLTAVSNALTAKSGQPSPDVALAGADASHPLLPHPSPAIGRTNPASAPLAINTRISGSGSAKEVRQVAFNSAGCGLAYEAGDALGVWPVNDPALVADMITAAGVPSDAAVYVKGSGEITLAEALTRHYEIARPSSDLLTLLAEQPRNRDLSHLMAQKQPLQSWLWGRQTVDVLRAFPICTTPEALLASLKRLQPRLYSISSSPKTTPDQIHLTTSVVRYHCNGHLRGGVCSTYLADRVQNGTGVFVQRSPDFRPPVDPTAKAIMVGPGTGVAPFRAFLQDRQARGATGQNWPFFGEQTAAHDFYYRDELLALHSSGALHHLDTAFSRDQAEKIYVQHRMQEAGAELWRWLEDGAHFYVCGDATRMAKDVDTSLLALVAQHGNLGEDAAQDYVAGMRRTKRYVRDVY